MGSDSLSHFSRYNEIFYILIKVHDSKITETTNLDHSNTDGSFTTVVSKSLFEFLAKNPASDLGLFGLIFFYIHVLKMVYCVYSLELLQNTDKRGHVQ